MECPVVRDPCNYLLMTDLRESGAPLLLGAAPARILVKSSEQPATRTADGFRADPYQQRRHVNRCAHRTGIASTETSGIRRTGMLSWSVA